VSSVDTPRRALVSTGFPFKSPSSSRRTCASSGASRGAVRHRRAGGAALDLAWLASGRPMLRNFVAPWDIAAGLLLVREAGGRVTDLEGLLCRIIRPSSRRMAHEWLLECLR
jgi:myo-inositol-1(or 4)-monophosphatase